MTRKELWRCSWTDAQWPRRVQTLTAIGSWAVIGLATSWLVLR